ncbi:hypothetical protein OAJ77_00210 [Rhodospirillales bacterium]|nr:hypothetical protein [Rhodospirillales bacterium]
MKSGSINLNVGMWNRHAIVGVHFCANGVSVVVFVVPRNNVKEGSV